jgi:hypothetical protein
VDSTKRSEASRSTAPHKARRAPRRSRLDIYLFPAVVGGGLGDIEEVLCAGRRLAASGFSLRLFRAPGRPLPPSVSGPWEWPHHRRLSRLGRTGEVALTISAGWGTTAAPARDEPFGRAGPWAFECAQIEARYGADHVVHVSFEEFARTLTSREQTAERWREGGVPVAAIRSRLRGEGSSEVSAFERAYRKFRGFDRPNVLHLFATLQFDPRFARAFPEAVQTGPLWPKFRWPPGRRARSRTWIWYASPSTSERLIPVVGAALATLRVPPLLLVHTPRPFTSLTFQRNLTIHVGALPPTEWRRQFAAADVRIVTGSRTLLEALELGRPFLYFNGLLGTGASARRHRPEKIASLLRLGRRHRVPRSLQRDLSDFARGRRIRDVVVRAGSGEGPWNRFPRFGGAAGFDPPYDDAGSLLVTLARRLQQNPGSAAALVAQVRAHRLGGPMGA